MKNIVRIRHHCDEFLFLVHIVPHVDRKLLGLSHHLDVFLVLLNFVEFRSNTALNDVKLPMKSTATQISMKSSPSHACSVM